MKSLLVIIITFCSFSVFSQSNLNGRWNTGQDNTIIEITISNGKWIGKIKSSDNEKAEIGKLTLKELQQEESKWTGKIYAAKRKDWYDVEITLHNDILELKISIGLLSKSLEWKKEY